MTAPKLDVKLSEVFKSNPKELGLLIAEVAREWRVRLDERMRPLDMSGARWVALLCLRELGPVSQKQLAESIGVEGPTLVRLLDRLEADNWVARKVSTKDRRVKIVTLKAKAHTFLDEFVEIACGIRNELIADIPDEKLKDCVEVLVTIRDRLSLMGHAEA